MRRFALPIDIMSCHFASFRVMSSCDACILHLNTLAHLISSHLLLLVSSIYRQEDRTPLSLAASSGHSAACEALCQSGAYASLPDIVSVFYARHCTCTVIIASHIACTAAWRAVVECSRVGTLLWQSSSSVRETFAFSGHACVCVRCL